MHAGIGVTGAASRADTEYRQRVERVVVQAAAPPRQCQGIRVPEADLPDGKHRFAVSMPPKVRAPR
jgi:hypothetical protein